MTISFGPSDQVRIGRLLATDRDYGLGFVYVLQA